MEQLPYNYLVYFQKKGKVIEQEYCHTTEEVKVLSAIARSKGYDYEVFNFNKDSLTEIQPPIVEEKNTQKTRIKKIWERSCRCLETGMIYESIRECSRQVGIPYKSIYNSIKSGNSRNGLHFAFENSDYVEPKKISPQRRKRKPISNKTFICITNNETFRSAEECIKKYGIPPTSFYRALKTGKPIKNLMFIVKKETAYFHKQAASS